MIDGSVDFDVGFLLQTFVPWRRIGHDRSLANEVRLNDRKQIGNGHAVHIERAGDAAALNQRQQDILVRSASALLRNALDAADVGFIDLNYAAAANVIAA